MSPRKPRVESRAFREQIATLRDPDVFVYGAAASLSPSPARERGREEGAERRAADGGSKVVVLTQIKQHLVRVLTSSRRPRRRYRRPSFTLSLPLSFVRALSLSLSPACDNTDNGNVTCARPPTAGNTAMQTRMQIHLGMHFNANYERRSEFQRDSLVKSKTRCHLALPIARFGL